MAKNWKRAHDAVKEERDTLKISNENFQRWISDECRNHAETCRKLSLACSHLLAAADQLDVRQAPATAALLRRTVDAWSNPVTAKAINEERR